MKLVRFRLLKRVQNLTSTVKILFFRPSMRFVTKLSKYARFHGWSDFWIICTILGNNRQYSHITELCERYLVSPFSIKNNGESLSCWGQYVLLQETCDLLNIVSIIVDLRFFLGMFNLIMYQAYLLKFRFQLLSLNFKRAHGLFQSLLLCLKIHSFCSLMFQNFRPLLPMPLHLRIQCFSFQLK